MTSAGREFLRTDLSPAAPIAVPLFDMQRQYHALRDELLHAIERVCESTRFIMGPDCQEFEQHVARYCQVEHAIGCASGSDALLLALMACGIGPGHEVLMPSYTFFATASAVWRLGAKPVFVDIEPPTFNVNPALLEAAINPATKAMIPVHLYGQCAEMEPIMALARRHRLHVIEDAAQAIGALYDGRQAGSLGDIGCLSFYPTKNLGGFGDGGLMTTNDAALAAKLRLYRAHGMEPRYHHHVVGINSRLDSLQAAVLNVKMPHLERWTELRQMNADNYTTLFASCGLDRVLTLPIAAPRRRHVWNQYVVRVPDGRRDALRKHLAEQKIGTEIYYPLALHQQPCFASLGYAPGSLPETERAAIETLALPIFPELSMLEQVAVVGQIATFFGLTLPATQAAVRRPKFMSRPATVREEFVD